MTTDAPCHRCGHPQSTHTTNRCTGSTVVDCDCHLGLYLTDDNTAQLEHPETTHQPSA